MSGDMRDWRPLLSTAAGKLNSFKGYLASKDPRPFSPASSSVSLKGGTDPVSPGADPGPTTRQSWTQWAGDKLRRGNQYQGDNANVVEKVALFPGWAARRLHRSSPGEDTHFDAEVFVAGFASRLNNPDVMSRSQRAFLRLAKGFASLPKLPDELQLSQPSPPSSEITEMQSLEEHFRKFNNDPDAPPSDPSSAVGTPFRRSPSTSSLSSSSSDTKPVERTSSTVSTAQALHANLEQRLMLFWSSMLSNRAVRISLYASEEAASIAQALGREAYELDDPRLLPIASRLVTTTQDGSFQTKFGIPCDVLRKHPDGAKLFSDASTEYDLFIVAELLPPPPPPPTSAAPQPVPINNTPVSQLQVKVSLSYAPVRVISDIDDTVKLANVLAGARVVFNTVFVQNLVDLIIPGMGDWYTSMWRRGVRFHYVSNGPFEVLPVLNEFFPLAKLPPGSIKLRSYAGRSLFNGFLSAPAARKRQGVIDILNSFPESQFILVGDSGEQDMELYATVAMERPQQVLAVFIRDARSSSVGEKPQPIEDPTGAAAQSRWKNRPQRSDSGGSTKNFRQNTYGVSNETPFQPVITPGPTPLYQGRPPSTPSSKRQGSLDYFGQPIRSPTVPGGVNDNGSGPWLNSTQIREEPTTGEIDISVGIGPKPAKMPDVEWKRLELQMRVDRARMNIPQSVRFRLFVNPEECTEAFEALDQVNQMDTTATT